MTIDDATLAASADRLGKYNLDPYHETDNPYGLAGVGGADNNIEQAFGDVGTVGKAAAARAAAAKGSQDAAAGSAQASAGSAAAADAARVTTQGLRDQTQALRDAAAADRVLAQQFVGTATNMIVPIINTRLASAWDATGQPTAYALTNVVNVLRYDTRQDSDRGRWRKGKVARGASWYQETLNTSTRGAKREFPVVALLVLTQTMFVIYDAHDLDGSGSPRMWMVFNNANGALVFSPPTWVLNKVSARNGWLLFANNGSGGIGMFRLDFLRDGADRIHTGGAASRTTIAGRNIGVATEKLLSAATSLPNGVVNDVDLRVLPGALLDPVSRLPIPTMLVSTSAGFSLVWPTGQVTTVTYSSGFARAQFWGDHRIMAQYGGTNSFSVGPIPYTTMADSSWPRVYLDGSTTALRHLGTTVYGMLAAAPGAIGHDNGLTLIAEDRGNTLNSVLAYVTRSYATGWMVGDTRMATLCEGAGGGASGGELFGNGDFATNAGWVMNGSWGVDTANKVANCASAGGWLKKAVALSPNTTYTFTFDAVITGGGYLACAVFDADGGSNQINAIGGGVSASGSFVLSVTTGAASAMAGIYFSGGTGNGAAVRNFRLRKAGTFTDAIVGTGELVSGGDGTTTAGWTAANSGALSVSGGYLRVTNGAAAFGQARQALSTVPGETYAISFAFSLGTATGTVGALLGTSAGIADLGLITSSGASGTVLGQFKATGTTTYLSFQADNSAGHYFDVKTISVKQAVPDRGPKGKGLITVGTLARTLLASTSDQYEYSGFNANNYFEQPYSSDIDPGTGDLVIRLRAGSTVANGYFVDRDSTTGTGARFSVTASANKVALSVSDGTNTLALVSYTDFTAASNPRHVWTFIIRRATQMAEIWCDGVLDASTSCAAIGSLTNTAARLRVGERVALSAPAPGLSISMLRIGTYAPTPAQIRKMDADEMAAAAGKMMLGGTSNSVRGLSVDDDTGVMAVATADGVDQFSGLRRISHLAPAAGTAFTVAPVASVSAGGGAVLIGTASEAGLVTELQPIKDELRQPAGAANGNDPVFEGFTTDATPTDLGRVFISEGETVLVTVDVVATGYGQNPAEGASYTVRARVRRNLGGNVQLVGSAFHITVDETTSTLDATITVDTAAQALCLNVTGQASTRLMWRARLRLDWIGDVRNAA